MTQNDKNRNEYSAQRGRGSSQRNLNILFFYSMEWYDGSIIIMYSNRRGTIRILSILWFREQTYFSFNINMCFVTQLKLTIGICINFVE